GARRGEVEHQPEAIGAVALLAPAVEPHAAEDPAALGPTGVDPAAPPRVRARLPAGRLGPQAIDVIDRAAGGALPAGPRGRRGGEQVGADLVARELAAGHRGSVTHPLPTLGSAPPASGGRGLRPPRTFDLSKTAPIIPRSPQQESCSGSPEEA